VIGTHVLLEAVAAPAGSDASCRSRPTKVYGDIAEGASVETDALRPSSPYSASKAGGELIVLAYRRTYGTPVVVTRSSNNYGPWQYPEKIVPLFVTNALDGLPLPIYGDGRNVRDWIYVDDNCRAARPCAARRRRPVRSTTWEAATRWPTSTSRGAS